MSLGGIYRGGGGGQVWFIHNLWKYETASKSVVVIASFLLPNYATLPTKVGKLQNSWDRVPDPYGSGVGVGLTVPHPHAYPSWRDMSHF